MSALNEVDENIKNVRIVVAGGRDFSDCDMAFRKLDRLTAGINLIDIEVVCGLARGADTVGRLWAEARGVTVSKFKADWDKFGKRAGYLRNEEMAKHATHLVAFWDGVSKGTAHMIKLGEKHKLETRIIRYEKKQEVVLPSPSI